MTPPARRGYIYEYVAPVFLFQMQHTCYYNNSCLFYLPQHQSALGGEEHCSLGSWSGVEVPPRNKPCCWRLRRTDNTRWCREVRTSTVPYMQRRGSQWSSPEHYFPKSSSTDRRTSYFQVPNFPEHVTVSEIPRFLGVKVHLAYLVNFSKLIKSLPYGTLPCLSAKRRGSTC